MNGENWKLTRENVQVDTILCNFPYSHLPVISFHFFFFVNFYRISQIEFRRNNSINTKPMVDNEIKCEWSRRVSVRARHFVSIYRWVSIYKTKSSSDLRENYVNIVFFLFSSLHFTLFRRALIGQKKFQRMLLYCTNLAKTVYIENEIPNEWTSHIFFGFCFFLLLFRISVKNDENGLHAILIYRWNSEFGVWPRSVCVYDVDLLRLYSTLFSNIRLYADF